MKKLFAFSKKNATEINIISLGIFMVVLIFLIPYGIKIKSSVDNIRFWYLIALMCYTAMGIIIINEINRTNVHRFLGGLIYVRIVINISICILLLIGFILHFFPFFPDIIESVIGGLVGLISFILFFVLMILEYHTFRINYYCGK